MDTRLNRFYGLFRYNNTYDIEYPASIPRIMKYAIQEDVPASFEANHD